MQLKDLVAFYIDPKQQVKNCDVVGFNVMVLKHSEHAILDLTKPLAKKAEKPKSAKKAKDAAEPSKETGKKGDRRRRLSSRKKSESSGKEDSEKPARPQVTGKFEIDFREVFFFCYSCFLG